MLSLISDLLSLFLTIHLRIGYEFTRAVYWAAGVRLGGGLLWGVFRGDYFSVDIVNCTGIVTELISHREKTKCLA